MQQGERGKLNSHASGQRHAYALVWIASCMQHSSNADKPAVPSAEEDLGEVLLHRVREMGMKPTPRGTAYAPMSAKPTIAISASIRSLPGDIDPPASLPSEVVVAAAVAAGRTVCVPELRTAHASGSGGGTELARHVMTGTLATGGTGSPSKPDEDETALADGRGGPTSDGHADEPRKPDTHVHIEQGRESEPPAGAQDPAPTVLSVTGPQAAALTPTPAEVFTTPRPEPAEKRGATGLTISNEAGANNASAANGDATTSLPLILQVDGNLPKKKKARPLSSCVPSAEASPPGAQCAHSGVICSASARGAFVFLVRGATKQSGSLTECTMRLLGVRHEHTHSLAECLQPLQPRSRCVRGR